MSTAETPSLLSVGIGLFSLPFVIAYHLIGNIFGFFNLPIESTSISRADVQKAAANIKQKRNLVVSLMFLPFQIMRVLLATASWLFIGPPQTTTGSFYEKEVPATGTVHKERQMGKTERKLELTEEEKEQFRHEAEEEEQLVRKQRADRQKKYESLKVPVREELGKPIFREEYDARQQLEHAAVHVAELVGERKKEFQNELHTANNRIKALSAAIDEEANRAAEAENKYRALKIEFDKVKKKGASLIQEVHQQIEQNQENFASVEKRYHQELDQRSQEIYRLQREMVNQRNYVSELESSLSQMRQELVEEKKRSNNFIHQWESEKSRASNLETALIRETETLSKALESEKNSREKLESQLKENNQRLVQAEQRLHSLENNYNSEKNRSHQLEEQLQKRNQQVENIKKQLSSLGQERNELTNQINDAKKRLAQRRKEGAPEKEDKLKRIERLRAQVAELVWKAEGLSDQERSDAVDAYVHDLKEEFLELVLNKYPDLVVCHPKEPETTCHKVHKWEKFFKAMDEGEANALRSVRIEDIKKVPVEQIDNKIKKIRNQIQKAKEEEKRGAKETKPMVEKVQREFMERVPQIQGPAEELSFSMKPSSEAIEAGAGMEPKKLAEAP